MSTIDPQEFGALTAQVTALEKQVNDRQADVKLLLAFSKIGTGQYRLTFPVAHADTNYRTHATIAQGTVGWVQTTKTTGYVDVFCTNSAGSPFDPVTVDVTVFG